MDGSIKKVREEGRKEGKGIAMRVDEGANLLNAKFTPRTPLKPSSRKALMRSATIFAPSLAYPTLLITPLSSSSRNLRLHRGHSAKLSSTVARGVFRGERGSRTLEAWGFHPGAWV